MKRHLRRSIAAACTRIFAVMIVVTIGTMAASDAQTWHWTYVTSTPNSPFVAAQSTVSISANTIHMEYAIPLHKRQVVIESCSGDLHDVQDATTLRSADTTYLVIRFKPERSATCAAGKQSSVALPTARHQDVSAIAAAINASSGSVAARAATPRPRAIVAAAATPSPATTAKPSPSPKPTTAPSPTGAPTASASATPPPAVSATPASAGAALQDWVENNGLFWFVRIRNSSTVPLTSVGDVFNCRNVDVGCGAFSPTRLEPGGAATVATVAAANPVAPAAFQYRFTAGDGAQVIAGAGSSTKAAPRGIARMSAAELRDAQAGALDQFRAPRNALTPTTPARLIKRGSSRLAIGQTGTALVRLMIAANGTPQEATIVSVTNRALTAAAIETAVSSTYAPAMENGRAVVGKYVATFSFDGEDPALVSVPVWKRAPSPAPSISPAASDSREPPPSQTVPTSGTAPEPSTPANSPSASPVQAQSQPASPQVAPPAAPPAPNTTPVPPSTTPPTTTPVPPSTTPAASPTTSPVPPSTTPPASPTTTPLPSTRPTSTSRPR